MDFENNRSSHSPELCSNSGSEISATNYGRLPPFREAHKKPIKIFRGNMLLMNGDVPAGEFTLTEYKNKTMVQRGLFPEFEAVKIKQYSDKICFDDKFLYSFLMHRTPYKHRAHIRQLMYVCRTYNLYDLIQHTHLTSLNDTFWVKPADSGLSWEQVSPYRGDFDKTAAETAFSGIVTGNKAVKATPELSTDGTFPKCWIKDKSGDIFLKKGGGLTEDEPYSEYYSQQILEALDIPHVKYDLYKDECLYTVCKLFTSEDTGFIPVGQICKGYFEDILSFMKILGMERAFFDMLTADTIMMNEDRHTGNFGFLTDNRTGKIIGFAPLFDHNLSLMRGLAEPTPEALKFKRHKLDNSMYTDTFTDIINFDMISAQMRKRLKAMRGFKLKKHPEYNLPDDRLAALNSLINHQINSLLTLKP